MRCVSLFLAAICTAAVPAAAQETTDSGPIDELSELERLSRSADDPFAGVIEEVGREPVSVTLRALNKITARYTDLEIEMHQIARFGALEIQPRTCDKRPPEEFPETTAFLEVFDLEFDNRQSNLKIQSVEIIEDEIAVQEFDVLPAEPVGEAPVYDAPPVKAPAPIVLEGPQAEGVNIFRGWMFASSPALNALEHPVYDVWVIDCTTRPTSS
ncbi:MAG: DUF2155 domain-containing protein [Pseudomonadota bacterium]